MSRNFLFLVRGTNKSVPKALGSKLMEHGHTVFLSDAEDDLSVFADVLDGFVEVAQDGSAATLYALHASERHELAVLALPADDTAVSAFADSLTFEGSAR
ncbi:MAG TPA: hypothetical protein VGO62_06265 [Myxococcota bacterium]|jgi:hypothetical protein